MKTFCANLKKSIPQNPSYILLDCFFKSWCSQWRRIENDLLLAKLRPRVVPRVSLVPFIPLTTYPDNRPTVLPGLRERTCLDYRPTVMPGLKEEIYLMNRSTMLPGLREGTYPDKRPTVLPKL